MELLIPIALICGAGIILAILKLRVDNEKNSVDEHQPPDEFLPF